MGKDSDSKDDTTLSELSNAFADTSILINYIQKDIVTDYTSTIVEGDRIEIIVGINVKEEFEEVSERRNHIYEDFLDFIIKEEGDVEDYDQSSRRIYIGPNDEEHVRELQMKLIQYETRSEILRKLRKYLKHIDKRIEYIEKNIIEKNLFDDMPGPIVVIELDDEIPNDDDVDVVADAALWSAEGNNSSGVFLTKDGDDLLEMEENINEALQAVRDKTWELDIIHPKELSEEAPEEPS